MTAFCPDCKEQTLKIKGKAINDYSAEPTIDPDGRVDFTNKSEVPVDTEYKKLYCTGDDCDFSEKLNGKKSARDQIKELALTHDEVMNVE